MLVTPRGKCNQNIAENTLFIECRNYDIQYQPKCTNLIREEFNQIHKQSKKKTIKWICKSCEESEVMASPEEYNLEAKLIQVFRQEFKIGIESLNSNSESGRNE